jgi:hypothetical protein
LLVLVQAAPARAASAASVDRAPANYSVSR